MYYDFALLQALIFLYNKTFFPYITDIELFWEKAFTEDDVIKITEKYMPSLTHKRSKVEQSIK